MKTICVANNKGGCAKTTTTEHLGVLLADHWGRVLLVDLDPQFNLTKRFPTGGSAETIATVLGGAAPGVEMKAAICQVRERLHLCPSEFNLANVALGLLNDPIRGRTALRRALRSVAGQYDVCLVDCPPEAGILLVNGLLAADGVLLPAEPEMDALDGAQRVTEMVRYIRDDDGGVAPMVLGTVATRVDSRTNRHLDGLELMRKAATPLLGVIPERNGERRERDLRWAYRAVADGMLDWLGGQDA